MEDNIKRPEDTIVNFSYRDESGEIQHAFLPKDVAAQRLGQLYTYFHKTQKEFKEAIKVGL